MKVFRRAFSTSLNDLNDTHRLNEFGSVIDIRGFVEPNPFAPLVEFRPALESLFRSEPYTCKTSGRNISGVVPPSLAIIDVSYYFAPQPQFLLMTS